MSKLTKSSKILQITHNDLDGVSAAILFSNIFKNIDIISTGFHKIDEYLTKIRYEKFDHIFLTDIYPDNRELLEISDKIKILDHHSSANDINNPAKTRYVNPEKCATLLVKEFLEKYFCIDLKQFNTFCNLIDDYDRWLRKDKRSWALNEIYGRIGFRKFLCRFFNGNVYFNSEEVLYLKQRYNLYNDTYENLEVINLEKINGCFIVANDFLNDLASDLMKKEGYKVVFCYNPVTEHLSLRHNYDKMHIGNILTELNLGGGHEKAGGLNKNSKDLLQTQIRVIENKIYEKFEELRK